MSGTTQLVGEGDEFIRRSALDGNNEPIHHVYVDGESQSYFSVTTVLNNWDDDEKERKLQAWRERNDGTDGTEHHSDLLRYAQLRGTLLHAEAQEKYVDEQVWGTEEDMAEEELKNFGEFKGEDAFERYKKERDYFVDKVHSMLDSEIDEVLHVEDFCFHGNPAYAGQVDFVYRNNDDEIVVCDLKTSKQVGYTYLLQTNAYAKVIEQQINETVDKLQVARANPDTLDSELYTVDRNEMAIQFCCLTDSEYGLRICLDAPYEAKDAIKNSLDWDLHHQSWDTDKEMWTIAIRNKDGIVSFDFALFQLNQQGWSVNIDDKLIETIIHTTDVEEEEIKRTLDDRTYDSWGEQLSTEFDELAEQMNNERRPLTFPEEILLENAQSFNDTVVTDSLEFIETHKGNLGDKHPHESVSAVLVLNGADKETVNTVFSPNNLEENTELYEELLQL